MYDWKNNKGLFICELIGTISSMLAAALFSFFTKSIDLKWIFMFYIIGSIGLMISSYTRNLLWPTCLMIIYTIFNIIGLYHSL